MSNPERIPKLIPGRMNVLRTILKPGYAEGVARPKRVKAKAKTETVPFNQVRIILRKVA